MSIESVRQSAPLVTTPVIRQSEVAVSPSARANTAAGATLEARSVGQQSAGQPPVTDDLLKALDEVREAVKPVAQSLHFSLDEDTGRTIVKVMDTETNEMIRQIPSEDMLRIAKAIDKLQGLLIRQEA